MRIAYFINQYPKVSHSFIRREILALERQGVEVQRIALRGWDAELQDADDASERAKTRYVLQRGIKGLLAPAWQVLRAQPRRFFQALQLAMRVGLRADRAWPYHLVYLAEACQVLQWLQAGEARHVHAHFGTNSTEVVMLANVLGGPAYSFTVHGPEEFDKPQFLHMGEKVRRAAFVAAVSSYGRSQLFRWVAHDHWAKVKVVHCGLERSFHEVAPVGVPTAPRLVCVGRLCEQKGQLLLLEAARVLAARSIAFELVLAGDGEMRGQVEALIARHGLQQQVRITGWISSAQVREEILAARALVLPSFAEGLPVVIMEAMALRRPVLTTYVAGIPELVRPGENGWLFPAGAVDELAAAMADCLAQPAEVLQRMGEAARQRVLQRHDIDTEAARLASYFKASA
ncbi:MULTISPECIES: glycosyltransferase [Pseudomonas]|uniref:Glycosyltransferase n=1 Tax=Pseudomonas asiatica TaxID=2219225 RepID=A0ABU5KXT1_9PSED|nr:MULTISPECIES: glycosyltransferase [Pseudomonas]GLO30836.1 colanic acid biosynthesis glycosyltransferase WcaL [Pseudomonas putida]KYC19704.1 colanic acid biosynthesis glycosyltransferase WcaL [Pseudomonas sp. ABFPK]MBA6111848.1 glycosyltransferase [Pseudomonas asiatica]MDZ5738388.1 glycosyltransferase [Pseudomonas asiatica]MDZ5743515.1 glycosyltransferase [Pseudomonas asiatica]